MRESRRRSRQPLWRWAWSAGRCKVPSNEAPILESGAAGRTRSLPPVCRQRHRSLSSVSPSVARAGESSTDGAGVLLPSLGFPANAPNVRSQTPRPYGMRVGAKNHAALRRRQRVFTGAPGLPSVRKRESPDKRGYRSFIPF